MRTRRHASPGRGSPIATTGSTRRRGSAGLFLTSVLPFFDEQILMRLAQLEMAAYAEAAEPVAGLSERPIPSSSGSSSARIHWSRKGSTIR